MQQIKFLIEKGVNSCAFKKAQLLREEVFVKEQKADPKSEFDQIDYEAYHVVGLDEKENAICCARVFSKDNVHWIGRVAVDANVRGQQIGKKLFQTAEQFIITNLNPKTIVVHSQKYIQNFYASFGYLVFGEPDIEEGIEHVYMKKDFALME